MGSSTEPPLRIWSKDSIEILASRFDLPNHISMQDWAYEVSDPKRIREFYNALAEFKDQPDVCFTLMDILLQSFEEQGNEFSKNIIWQSLLRHIEENFELHSYQVWYWSALDVDIDDGWQISPFLRSMWNRLS